MIKPNSELMASLLQSVQSCPGLRVLSEKENAEVLAKVAALHLHSERHVYWWEALKTLPRVLSYGDSDGLLILEQEVEPRPMVYFFATDDNPPPWQGFIGSPREILKVIREERFFEYFISDIRCRKIVFDTHHNQLIISELPADIEN